LNPRPLGYEPYDAHPCRLGLSLAGVVTSADRPGPSRSVGSVSPVSYCLAASGLQIGLQNRLLICRFPAPLRALLWLPSLGARHRVRTRQATARRRGLDTRRVASGRARRQAARRPVAITAAGSAPGHRPHRRQSSPSPNPAAAGPDGRRGSVQGRRSRSRSDPQAPQTGSGWRGYSYGGFGGGHPLFRPHTGRRQPGRLTEVTVFMSVGNSLSAAVLPRS
jgi:hypothetical protein